MINWQFFPKSSQLPDQLRGVIEVFEGHSDDISSAQHSFSSNDVLAIVRDGLINQGYKVESSKKKSDKIKVPVLFGRNGKLEKYFDADAYHETDKIVLEVEAGRAVVNFQFLKDLFQACLMYNVDYLAIAVRNTYASNKDFETIITFFDALYASNRLVLPLKGILILGY